LRGASHPAELVTRAAELGYKALAITDLNGVYGIPKAYEATKENPTLKLIVGSELVLEDGARLTLLAQNRPGYGLMCRILTAVHAGKLKGEGFLSWAELSEFGTNKFPGLVAIPFEFASERIAEVARYFPERFYLPVWRQLEKGERSRIKKTLDLSEKLALPIVAVNSVHYHLPERRALQDVLVSIREGQPLKSAGHHLFSNAERYLKSPEQMARLFRDLPEALANTVRIAGQCTFSPSELRYRYPSEWIPLGETAQNYLERLTWEGARRRYAGGIPQDVDRQLRHELKLIQELGFADYFLTIWEIVEFARSRKILCQGRGSAANSAVCFCLEITAIDPVRMNLLFERFISAERGEPPDIDVDFEHERREEVIQHIYQKYGRDRAGMVSAIITYRSRSAVREVNKAFGADPEAEPSEQVSAMVEEIHGFPRHLSIHSGGFTLSADPIIETVPIEPARMEGRTIVQWDKEDLAVIGLLKVDILALGMLSAIRRTFDLIQIREPGREKLTIANIPPEDPKTYAMLQVADTVGVFQIESRAQMNMLHRLEPKCFYDLVVEVALVRPGPIVGQMVHPYLRRRRGLESSASPDPRLDPILGRTLGVPLFQEQVMKMAIVMANFTPGEADQLRRAIGAWRSNGTIEKMGKKLKEGFLANGLPLEFVERVFKQIKGFAEYGFPESHAASFALIAYASSYLKCHYPGEFACALLNSQPMGFYSSHTIIEDAKRHGVHVLPVHPNISGWECVMEKINAAAPALRLGFRIVNGLGETDFEKFRDIREQKSFDSFLDFLYRTHLPPRVLNRLALAGAFDSFGIERRDALWEILAVHSTPSVNSQQTGSQMDFFQVLAEATSASQPQFRPLSSFKKIQAEFEAFGLSVHGHPMGALRKILKAVPPTTTAAVKQTTSGRVVRLAGLVIARQRPQTAKGTVFATIEDEFGFTDLMLREEVYKKFSDVFVSEPFLVIRGKVQRDRGAVNILVDTVSPLFGQPTGQEILRTTSYDFH